MMLIAQIKPRHISGGIAFLHLAQLKRTKYKVLNEVEQGERRTCGWNMAASLPRSRSERHQHHQRCDGVESNSNSVYRAFLASFVVSLAQVGAPCIVLDMA